MRLPPAAFGRRFIPLTALGQATVGPLQAVQSAIVNFALGQCLLKFLRASVRDSGADKEQVSELIQPFQGIQPVVGDVEVLKGQLVELSQPFENVLAQRP